MSRGQELLIWKNTKARRVITLTLTYTLLGFVTVSCVSWIQSRKEEAPNSAAGATVVGQIGDKNTSLSRHPRSFWLNQRQSKDLMTKLKAALATGEAAEAESLARLYLAKHPGDAQGFAMLANALMLSKKYDLAAFYAEEAERLQPGKARFLNIKALASVHSAHARVQDYQAAVGLLKQAFESDPKEIAAGLNLGHLYLDMGSPDKAAEVFGQVSERCGRCVPALMGQGIGLARSSKFNDAVKSFEDVLKTKPSHPGALYQLAVVYKIGLNQPKKAESYLYALLQNKGSQYAAARARAHSFLRMIKGEAPSDERTELADDEKSDLKTGKDSKNSDLDREEAELMMTGAEIEVNP